MKRVSDLIKVHLLPHDIGYAKRIFELVSAPQIKHVLGIKDESIEDTERFIQWIIEEEQMGKQISRVICDEHGELIGITTLMCIKPQQKLCHIGTWIGHEFWGQGYNQASKVEILKIAFFDLGMEYVMAGARQTNIRSQRAQQKLPYIRLNVEKQFPDELHFLETKERQLCVLHAFYKEDFIAYFSENNTLS